MLTLRGRGWGGGTGSGGKGKCRSRFSLEEFQTTMSREPEEGTLKSLRHYILQVIERNPGVKGGTKKSKCVCVVLPSSFSFFHPFKKYPLVTVLGPGIQN